MTKTKTCQNCKNKFIIEPADFEFYKKIEVPEPTFCPDCRLQRRMAWRNEINMYKRKCDATNKDIISIYHPDSLYRIYDRKYWWSDKWDSLEYGQEYDFSKPFLEQFKSLYRNVPQIAIITDSSMVDSEYCNSSMSAKNCYLATNSFSIDNVLYSNRLTHCKDSLDLYNTHGAELSYENVYCYDSYKLFFSNHCYSCIESYFLYDCRNCQNCFGCVNLRNKKYHIFNQPYSKQEYFKRLKEFNLGSYKSLVEQKKKYWQMYDKAIHKFAQITKSVNCTGDELKNVKDCFYAFDVLENVEDCKFVNWGGYGCRDNYDAGPGFGMSELFYETVDSGLEAARNYFTYISWKNRDIYYSINCHSCSNLFGCTGLRHKKHCILNRQYTKQEYEEMVPKIIQHMNKMPYKDTKSRIYKYGEFFPIEFSPFAYNETIAQQHFPLTKKRAAEQGYNWHDRSKGEHKPTIKAKDLPNYIKEVDKSILKEIIECSNKDCFGVGVFRLIPRELEFYKKMNLPLPKLCPSCRHQERIEQRNPMKLWKRQCMNKSCSNTFQTTYAPDRKEIVYCEACYNKEIG